MGPCGPAAANCASRAEICPRSRGASCARSGGGSGRCSSTRRWCRRSPHRRTRSAAGWAAGGAALRGLQGPHVGGRAARREDGAGIFPPGDRVALGTDRLRRADRAGPSGDDRRALCAQGGRVKRAALAGAVGAGLALCWWGAGLHAALDLRALANFAHGLLPPDLSPAFLRVVAVATVRTLGIAIAGAALAIGFGYPLGLLAPPGRWRRRPLCAGVRGARAAPVR